MLSDGAGDYQLPCTRQSTGWPGRPVQGGRVPTTSGQEAAPCVCVVQHTVPLHPSRLVPKLRLGTPRLEAPLRVPPRAVEEVSNVDPDTQILHISSIDAHLRATRSSLRYHTTSDQCGAGFQLACAIDAHPSAVLRRPAISCRLLSLRERVG